MQETRFDDSQKLTDRATLSDFMDAIKRTDNKMVAMHKPGSIITPPNGVQYLVDETGAWQRIEEPNTLSMLKILQSAHKRETDKLCAQIAHWEERAHRAERALRSNAR